ncbi:hypothetical protein RA955_01235 [Geobacillus proteiniphilus]|uniref:Uncharacterized protein n=1 Tax=Geobacillus proteiniphilus TaxID=860353 RepID=A0A1Q5SPB4_9BACL|nr:MULTISPECIES: hypothetical protein [Geobacillus]OKO89776.1 hypothetical protein BRO54_3261 [Geobacillus proteiniphilus]OPX01775.1 hypothetical protein B1A75_15095 [Geobacillus sp. LEMMY01]WMJ16782.1 hypothetical protein RA955_01235 [Geobacillus proteiniphilus]
MVSIHHETLDVWPYALRRFLRCVIQAYCETAPSLRSPFYLLRLIDMHRSLLSLSMFPTPLHYGLVLAKVTDHLLQFFGSMEEAACKPLLLADGESRNEGEAEELIDLYIVYRDRVRVLLWCDEEEAIRRCKETASSLCREAIGLCPNELECCFLWTGGRRIEWIPA